MSNSQHDQTTLFFTVTGDADAHELIEQYQLRRVEGWNHAEIAEEQYQFEQMCLRFMPPEQPNDFCDVDQVLNGNWTQFPQYLQRTRQLPAHLQRTLHIVRHGVNCQSAGFHLSRDSVRQLARLNAAVILHGYQDVDDGLDFPYAKKLSNPNREPTTPYERVYFSVTSQDYSAAELTAKIGLAVDQSHSVGDFKRTHPQIATPTLWEWTSLTIDSGLTDDQPIDCHLEALLSKLETRHTEIWQMAQDYQIRFYVQAAGYVSNPHQRHLSSETIRRLARLGVSLDVDFYFV